MTKILTLDNNSYGNQLDTFVDSPIGEGYASMIMKKLLFLLLIGILHGRSIQAQQSILPEDSIRYTNYNVYGELGGPGFLSVNLERLFPIRKAISATGRIGLGFYPYELGIWGNQTKYEVVIPLTQSFLFGHVYAFEFGYGLTLGFYDDKDAFGGRGPLKWLHAIVGMRYQKPGRSFLFRLGYTPLINTNGICLDTSCFRVERELQLTHLFGISLGGRLKRTIN